MTESTPPSGQVCYRHTDRETYLRCTRCERLICPDCMVEAAVGFHCRDCVRDGNRGRRQGRTVFGGTVRADGALLTKAVIGVNLLVFALVYLVGPQLVNRLELLGAVHWEDQPTPEGVAYGEWWRLVTAAFVHVEVWHLLVNMVALWVLGPQLETVLGRLRFGVLYLLGAVGGSAASYCFNPPDAASVGASGALFALIGATLVIARRLRADLRGLVLMLAVNLALPFVIAKIDWKAHLGGLAVGLVVALGFAFAPRHRLNLVQGVVAGITALLLLGAVLARSLLIAG